MDLLPQYSTDDNGVRSINGYLDPWGTRWRQAEGGGWERAHGTTVHPEFSDWDPQYQTINWQAADPNRAPIMDLSSLDPGYLRDLGVRLGYVKDGDFQGSGNYDPTWIQNPFALDDIFAAKFPGRGANVNPYGNAGNAESLRNLAVQLGFSKDAADIAALREASSHYSSQHQLYSEASAPSVIGDDIARMLFGERGINYDGMTPEDRTAAVQKYGEYQRVLKEWDKSDWQRDDLGSGIAFEENRWGNIIDSWKHKPGRLLLGENDPLQTWIWNRVAGQHDDPLIGDWGGPTKQDYQDAAKNRIDPSSHAFIDTIIKQALNKVAGQYVGDAAGAVGDWAGLDPELMTFLNNAKTGYDWYNTIEKLYQTWDAYRDNKEGKPHGSQPSGSSSAPSGSQSGGTDSKGRPLPKRWNDDPDQQYGLGAPLVLADPYQLYASQQG